MDRCMINIFSNTVFTPKSDMIDYLKHRTRRGKPTILSSKSSAVNFIDEEMEIFGHRIAVPKVALKNFPYGIPWVMDDALPGCMLCLSAFTLFTRRHHCRLCGYLVCDTCSTMRVHLDMLNESHGSRICDYCVENTDVAVQSNTQQLSNRILVTVSPIQIETTSSSVPVVTPTISILDDNSTITVISSTDQPQKVIIEEETTVAMVPSLPKTPISSKDKLQQQPPQPRSILRQTPAKHVPHISKFEAAAENGVWEMNSNTPISSIASGTVTPSAYTDQHDDADNDNHHNDHHVSTERKAAARLAKADASVSKAIRHYGIWEADTDDISEEISNISFNSTPIRKDSRASFGSITPGSDVDWNIDHHREKENQPNME